MTLEETLKKMQKFAEVNRIAPNNSQPVDNSDIDDLKSANNDSQKEDDGKDKEIQAKKADTGTIYMGLANKGQTTKQPQNVNGVNVWTGDKEGSVLSGKKFIHPTKGAQILTSDKSDLLTTGQVEVNLKSGKGTAKVPFIGVKADKQGNPDPNGQQAIPTDIDTILKLEQGETKDLVVSNGNAMQAIGDDQKALATVDKETKELATQEGGELATTQEGALQLDQNQLTVMNQIQGEITNITNQLPKVTETGRFEDIESIYQKYKQDSSSQQDGTDQQIQAIENGQNSLPSAQNIENIDKVREAAGNDASDPKNPFEGLKKIGGILGGILGGIAKLAGMFVGGVAAGQANGKR